MQNESDKLLDELTKIAQEHNMGYEKPKSTVHEGTRDFQSLRLFPRWTGWVWCGIVLWPLIALYICTD